MKKKALLFPISLFLTLTSCSLPFFQNNDNNTAETPEITNPDDPKEDEPTDPIEVKDKIAIGSYGDYVEFASKDDKRDLNEQYTALLKEKTYFESGIFKVNYQVGLYEFFNYENQIQIVINITKDELNKLDNDHKVNNKETYRMCSLEITYLGLHFHYEEVGIRQKGNLSRGEILSGESINLRHYKLSFEETFDDEYTENPKVWEDEKAKAYREDRKFFGENKIDIRWNRNEDHTYLKEYYAYELYRSSGALAPRSNPVNVSLNIDGDKQNMGVYLAVENMNKSFIKRNFVKASRGGNLYKITWGSGEGGTFKSINDRLFGVETQIKNGDTFVQQSYTYDLKTNKDTPDHTFIKSFISTISSNDFHGSDSYDFFSSYSYYDAFISYLSCSYLLGDPDDLRGNYNNTYVYFAPNNDSYQIVIIPTDNDRALGASGEGGNPLGHYGTKTKPFDSRTGYSTNDSPLFKKTIISSNSTTIRSDYLNKINEIINGQYFNIDKFTSIFNKVKDNYQISLNLGSKINYTKINFDINESDDINSGGNLSIAKYFELKKNTFLNSLN